MAMYDEEFDETAMDKDPKSELDLEVNEDDDTADILDDIIDESDLELDEESEEKQETISHRYTQQELIKLKDDFNSEDPEIKEQTRDLVYRSFAGLVKFVIERHYASYKLKHYEDLLQVGAIGILEGFQQYSPDVKGVFYQPSTLITRYIRHEIREYIAKTLNDTTAKYHTIGRRMLEIVRRKKEAGEAVIPGDIANELGISLTTATRAIEAINANANRISLEATIKGGDTKVIDMTPSDTLTPEEAFLEQEFKDNIMDTLKFVLNDIQFRVIYYSYGFDNGEQRSRKEIAKLLNLPEEHVRKILSSAKTKLERYMRSSQAFSAELKARKSGYHTATSNKRSDEDLQRELDALDFSSITDIGFTD